MDDINNKVRLLIKNLKDFDQWHEAANDLKKVLEDGGVNPQLADKISAAL